MNCWAECFHTHVHCAFIFSNTSLALYFIPICLTLFFNVESGVFVRHFMIYIRPTNQHWTGLLWQGKAVTLRPVSTTVSASAEAPSKFDLGHIHGVHVPQCIWHIFMSSSLFIFFTTLCSISKWCLGRKRDKYQFEKWKGMRCGRNEGFENILHDLTADISTCYFESYK